MTLNAAGKERASGQPPAKVSSALPVLLSIVDLLVPPFSNVIHFIHPLVSLKCCSRRTAAL